MAELRRHPDLPAARASLPPGAARLPAAMVAGALMVAAPVVVAPVVAAFLASRPALAAEPHAAPSDAASSRHSALTRGTVTGWKLPRFASLEADVVNVRRGPGTRYPIDWVYHRRGLPVEIIREFGNWRQVRMPDGTTGWIYHALLTGIRGFLVTAPDTTLRRAPRPDSGAVAHLRRGVIGTLRHCEAGAAWCAVRVHQMRGWLPRSVFFGTYPNEAVGSR